MACQVLIRHPPRRAFSAWRGRRPGLLGSRLRPTRFVGYTVPMHAASILQAVLHELEAGRKVALCVIVATKGSTPQPAGVMVCVDEAARMTGTLGGGCIEADVRRKAHQLLADGHCEVVDFTLDGDFGYDDGMICGGRIDVAICPLGSEDDRTPIREVVGHLLAGRTATLPVCIKIGDEPVMYRIHLEAEPQLIIAGAGHISRVLARIMVPLGFGVHVVDDRAEYANAKRFPPPVLCHVGDIAAALSDFEVGARTYVVIVTRGHRHDEAALEAILGEPARYIGMIGSRRKIKVVFDDLRHRGATEERIARVHAPIGLEIGAVTTEEIAVSIAAQLVSVRREVHADVVEGPIPVPGEA